MRRSAAPIRPEKRAIILNRQSAMPGGLFAHPAAASDVNPTGPANTDLRSRSAGEQGSTIHARLVVVQRIRS
jgi:hypothetical protein